jgi:hypothetical protein
MVALASEKEAEDLVRRFRSKEALYHHLSERRKLEYPSVIYLFASLLLVNIHLPLIRVCTIEFLQQILEEKKKVLMRTEIKSRKLPSYKEFSVAILVNE